VWEYEEIGAGRSRLAEFGKELYSRDASVFGYFFMHMPKIQAKQYFDSGGISNPTISCVVRWFEE
jgi:hypothetical protein